MNSLKLKELLKSALSEDIGMGDLTTNAIFNSEDTAPGTFIAKADGILAGMGVIESVYSLFEQQPSVHLFKQDGEYIAKGQVIAEVEGSIQTLLSSERVILNLLQHLSGIATATHQVITTLNDNSISVVDTRKTLPGLRNAQKYAVTCGGGKNHRFRLDDGIMIKDNHIKAAGSITQAVRKVREKTGHMVKIEVETETKEQVLEAIEAKADVIMLDNRAPEQVREFVSIIPDGIIVEVSGGITPDNISNYKGCGAHVISLGWLTHSVKALDINFNLVNK